MTNFEKYKDDILRFGERFAINKKGGFQECSSIFCCNCKFHNESISCNIIRFNWLFKHNKYDFTEGDLIALLDGIGMDYCQGVASCDSFACEDCIFNGEDCDSEKIKMVKSIYYSDKTNVTNGN